MASLALSMNPMILVLPNCFASVIYQLPAGPLPGTCLIGCCQVPRPSTCQECLLPGQGEDEGAGGKTRSFSASSFVSLRYLPLASVPPCGSSSVLGPRITRYSP